MTLVLIVSCDICDSAYERIPLYSVQPYLNVLRKMAQRKGWRVFMHPQRKRLQDACPNCRTQVEDIRGALVVDPRRNRSVRRRDDHRIPAGAAQATTPEHVPPATARRRSSGRSRQKAGTRPGAGLSAASEPT